MRKHGGMRGDAILVADEAHWLSQADDRGPGQLRDSAHLPGMVGEAWAMPDWHFERILSPQEFLEYSRSWFKSGVRILGGCCGLGPEHISVLQELKSQ